MDGWMNGWMDFVIIACIEMYFSSSISSNLKKTLTANIDDFVQTNAITNVTQFDWSAIT
jgi:hypothetical protein